VSPATTNDALARIVRPRGASQWVMWECECSAECRELVTLTLQDFDERRMRGVLVVASGHAGARAA
jgi:hypothetical protein